MIGELGEVPAGLLPVQRLDHGALGDGPDRDVQPDRPLTVTEGQGELAATADHGQPVRLAIDPGVPDGQPVTGLGVEREPVRDTVGLGRDQGPGRIEPGELEVVGAELRPQSVPVE